jgi:hypothetical protein
VVDEADDRLDAQPPQLREAAVGTRPVGRGGAARSGVFPQHRIAQGAQAERCEAREIVGAAMVPAAVELGEVPVADAVDRAFDATPHRERAQDRGAREAAAPAGGRR